MKKLIAGACSLALLAGAAGLMRAEARYTRGGLEDAIASAVEWTKENNNPNDNIGTQASDIAAAAFSRAGIDYDYGAYLAELDGIVENYSSENSGVIQRYLMTVAALGGDSEYFGGRNLAGDATYYRSLTTLDDYTGALIAVNAGGITVPDDARISRENMIKTVMAGQNADGSFGGSVYTTAAAVIALADETGAYDIEYADGRGTANVSADKAVADALNYLSEQQSGDGDFYSLTDTAMVSLAIDAAGISQTDTRFVKNGNTVVDGILIYRGDDGGFSEDLNDTDATATAYALSAMVSNARVLQGREEFFNYRSNDAIEIPEPDDSSANSGTSSRSTPSGSTSSGSTSSGSSSSGTNRVTVTARPSSTTRPRVTLRPSSTARPTVTMKPRSTPDPDSAPRSSALPRITPSPTRRPDLIGPAQIVGPIRELDDSDYIEKPEPPKSGPAAAAASAIIGFFAAAALAMIIMAKKKIGLYKEVKQRIREIYRAKRHRRTEEHRRYEQRRRYEKRGKYNERKKYKGIK